MRTDICNDLPKCRIIFILTAMMIMFGTNNLFAQSNPIYQNGNVIVYSILTVGKLCTATILWVMVMESWIWKLFTLRLKN